MKDLYTATRFDRKELRSADFLTINPGLSICKRTGDANVIQGAQAKLIR